MRLRERSVVSGGGHSARDGDLARCGHMGMAIWHAFKESRGAITPSATFCSCIPLSVPHLSHGPKRRVPHLSFPNKLTPRVSKSPGAPCSVVGFGPGPMADQPVQCWSHLAQRGPMSPALAGPRVVPPRFWRRRSRSNLAHNGKTPPVSPIFRGANPLDPRLRLTISPDCSVRF